ncbi:helix-turn-helix domain-containing protein [Streptomyces sp. NPDC002309]
MRTARVTEIAARWQFADASHFIRQFKACYGATPVAYVRSHANAAGANPPDVGRGRPR